MDNQQTAFTVNAILDRYERDCLDELAPRTRKDYIRHIPILRRWFGERIADELRPRDFGPFLDVKRGYEQRKRQLAVLSSAFTNAVSYWYIMERNVLRDVKRKPSVPRNRLITDDEYNSFFASAPLRVQLAMELAQLVGQRQGDVLSLRWSQIKDGKIHLQQGKTGKRLAIKLSLRAKRTLVKCRQLPYGGIEYIIVNRNGAKYTSEGFRAIWQRTMKRWLEVSGRERFTFHDLRARCATKCKTPEEAMKLLGHSTLQMTMRVYRRGVECVDSH